MASLHLRVRLANTFLPSRIFRRFSSIQSERVRLVEVGPRDGLQNEPKAVSLETKISLIEKLADTGLTHIEAGAFVSPKLIPQMADSDKILRHLLKLKSLGRSHQSMQHQLAAAQPLSPSYSFLVPNLKGLQRALAIEELDRRENNSSKLDTLDEIAVFTAASETFSQKNINCSIAESLERFEPVIEAAKKRGIRVRAYVSMVLGCPYEGLDISPGAVNNVVMQLWNMGADEISLGDTIGTGTPDRTRTLLRHIEQSGFPRSLIAMHFHDTYGNALANIKASLDEGIRIFDSSVGGLGGCPFAQGATGNVATEDAIDLLNDLGYQCNVDLETVKTISAWIWHQLGKRPPKRLHQSQLR